MRVAKREQPARQDPAPRAGRPTMEMPAAVLEHLLALSLLLDGGKR